jgi:hypothetical protein
MQAWSDDRGERHIVASNHTDLDRFRNLATSDNKLTPTYPFAVISHVLDVHLQGKGIFDCSFESQTLGVLLCHHVCKTRTPRSVALRRLADDTFHSDQERTHNHPFDLSTVPARVVLIIATCKATKRKKLPRANQHLWSTRRSTCCVLKREAHLQKSGECCG